MPVLRFRFLYVEGVPEDYSLELEFELPQTHYQALLEGRLRGLEIELKPGKTFLLDNIDWSEDEPVIEMVPRPH